MTVHASEGAFRGRKIILGVSGGIAAYKIPELLRLFKKAGADVQVVMTPDAVRFVTVLTMGTLSEREVIVDVFPEGETGSWTKHITLGRWADLLVIAPATAQTLARLAYGFSDNMLAATALAARCPILLCPAMDHDMYVHPATRRNLQILESFGHTVMPAVHGPLASGLVGIGRLPGLEDVFAVAADLLHGVPEAGTASLQGKHVLVTAGPTREPLDPVRFMSNPSSGKMGYALAAAAARRGASVTLVSGPTRLDTPAGVRRVDVTRAQEMYEAVLAHADADVVLMAAAVSDYAPVETAVQKLKKLDVEITVRLHRTRDILAELGRMKRDDQILVGFAMETEDGLANARGKLEAKNLDWIVLNRLDEEGAGFETDTNRVMLLNRDGTLEDLPLMSKGSVAEALLNRITAQMPRPAA